MGIPRRRLAGLVAFALGVLVGFAVAGAIGWWLGRNDIVIEWTEE